MRIFSLLFILVKAREPRVSTLPIDIRNTIKRDSTNDGDEKLFQSRTPEDSGIYKHSKVAEPRETQNIPESDSKWESFLKWLPCFVIIYMFYCQAAICDEYFVPAIAACVRKYNIPEDVAGATLMALGANGPELFSNFVAVFIYGGSDIGIGTIVGSEIFNILCICGGSILVSPNIPLILEKVPFIRDSSFYGLSIVLLGITLYDGEVSTIEAWVMLSCCALFAITVVYTNKIVSLFSKDLTQSLVPRKATSMSLPGSKISFLKQNTVAVSHRLHSRMHDSRVSFNELTHLQVNQNSMILSNVDDEDAGITQVIDVKKVTAVRQYKKSRQDEADISILGRGGTISSLHIQAPTGAHMSQIIERLGKSEKTGLNHEMAKFKMRMTSSEVSIFMKLFFILVFPIDLLFGFSFTHLDCKIPELETRWFPSFVVCMLFLGFFSYYMVDMATKIHENFGISQAVLGVTVAAVGTSFPNFWSSIVMAREGRSSLAIANALGSNVQNVFLALALPWALRTTFPTTSNFPMPAPGIFMSVLWMAGTLAFFLAVAYFNNFQLYRREAYILIILYFLYLLYATNFG